MKDPVFHFKQFDVDQSGCGMKINTDGALLAAAAGHPSPQTILDIGTGTGVIALMLAQRFPEAKTDAVEIDPVAAHTALTNFRNSPFSARLQVFPGSFQDYFRLHPGIKYDLVVSNPPFFLHSLKSSDSKKSTAKHTEDAFFEDLVRHVSAHLQASGSLWCILPPETASLVTAIGAQYGLFIQNRIAVRSFPGHPVHREILALGFAERRVVYGQLSIYETQKQYSDDFRGLLRDFFTIF